MNLSGPKRLWHRVKFYQTMMTFWAKLWTIKYRVIKLCMCVLAPKLCLEISKGKEINWKLIINWPVIKDTDLLHVLINSVLISFHLESTFTMFYDPKKFSCLHIQYCMEVILILMVQRPFYKVQVCKHNSYLATHFDFITSTITLGSVQKLYQVFSQGLFIGENWSFIWNNSQIIFKFR